MSFADPFDRCPSCGLATDQDDGPDAFPYCDDLCEKQHADRRLIRTMRFALLRAHLAVLRDKIRNSLRKKASR